jgi:hypothetical protein
MSRHAPHKFQAGTLAGGALPVRQTNADGRASTFQPEDDPVVEDPI